MKDTVHTNLVLSNVYVLCFMRVERPCCKGIYSKWLSPDPNSPLLMRLPCSIYDGNRQNFFFFVGFTAGLFVRNDLVLMCL